MSQLEAAQAPESSSERTYHVASIGNTFYFAYEQLRNAAEYREHHLLLRGAIERYLARSVDLTRYRPVGADLVTELTQAGYLKNDSVHVAKLGQIDEILRHYSALFEPLVRTHQTGRTTAVHWLFQIASVQIEGLLSPNRRLGVFMAFAYEHYLGAIDPAVAKADGESETAYQVALYCAMQRALFKSDLATTRYYCIAASLPGLSEQTLAHFAAVNRSIDERYQSPQTNRLFRIINRYGAPMRILREVIAGDKVGVTALAEAGEVLTKVKRVCQQQYALTRKRLNKRILKTIFFIFITKTIIGVAIEVPYDLFAMGAIAWVPLLANISFPVIYMALLSLRMAEPDRHNTEVIASYVERILYEGDHESVRYRIKKRVGSDSLRNIFGGIYVIGFAISFGLLTWMLYQLQFNVVNGVIFFIFLSAVSFLGFRLRQSARELAMLDERPGILQTLADFLSTPFVRVGQWLSDRYSRLNIVTLILDVMIEMPFKTSLRLLQQWAGFMRDKQEEL